MRNLSVLGTVMRPGRSRRVWVALLALVVSVLLAGFVSQAARASTAVAFDPFDFTVTICNGDVVELTGTDVTAFSVGSNMLTSAHSQDLTGVDLTTGTVYHGEKTLFDIVPPISSGGGVETFTQDMRLVAAGGQRFTVTGLFHITVAPDGTVHVIFVKASSTC